MLNIAMAFHAGDKEQVARWLGWMEELGGIGRHKLWLLPARGQIADFQTSIPFTALSDQYGVQTDWSEHNGPVRDAAGANSMVRQFAWHFFMEKLGPWMFCEPDAIPLRVTAFDELEDEYRASGKLFLGALVPGKENEYPEHATGNMIFCENALAVAKKLMLPCCAEFEGRRVELAFDIVAAPDILGPNFHETKLIQHVFRGPEFEKMDDLAKLNPAACIFHTDKRGGLIRLLREKRQGSQEAKASDCKSETQAVNIAGSTPAPVTAPRVHTYFRPCVDPEALAEQKRILAIWEKNWRDAGWEPVILTEAHARQHPQFEKYRKAFEAMPTVSPKEYEMACWLRWVAMAANGGGLMTDYDVLNDGWTPDWCPKWALDNSSGHGEMAVPFIFSTNNPVPCVVAGTAGAYERAVKAFSKATERFKELGGLHVSDQLLIQKWGWSSNDTCREFCAKGWQAAKLVHFSHRACGNDRSLRMNEWVFRAPIKGGFPIKPKEMPKLDRSRKPRTTADSIAELVEFSKKDGFAKGRIVKQLRKAGLIPKK